LPVPEAAQVKFTVAAKSKPASSISAITIRNKLSSTVYIYSEDTGKLISEIPALQEIQFDISKRDTCTLMARDQKDTNPLSSSIVGACITYPGCTTWTISSFPTGSFRPSAWPKLHGKLQAPWEVSITNKLKTYVCIWQVLPHGRLHFVHVMSQCSYTKAFACYIGTSLVASQGNTIISKFFADSIACTEWSITNIIDGDGGDEPVKNESEDYTFFHFRTTQDDTVIPISKDLPPIEIKISSRVKFLYASLFDSSNAYFVAPEGVTVTIDSQDKSDTITHYNSNTNTKNLYIQMTNNGKSLQKLCVKNPTVGTWKIKIEYKTNTPMVFQFQTVPTDNPYDTMRAMHSQKNWNWKHIAYAGFANIANASKFGKEKEKVTMPAAVAAVGMALLNETEDQWASLYADLQNDDGETEEVINTVHDAAAPVPPNLPDVLLVDAFGADEFTKRIYEGRMENLYPKVKSGKFRHNYSELVGKKNATHEQLINSLRNPHLKLVSVAGHGNDNNICGYTELANARDKKYTKILQTSDVEAELVQGKIFHFFACLTANGLGRALVENGAAAYIGYNINLEIHTNDHLYMFKPDCIIVKSLINGKNIFEACELARAEYNRLMNEHKKQALDLLLPGILKNHRDALVVQVRGDTVIPTLV